MKKMSKSFFRESVLIPVKAVGKDWDIVLIESGLSKNGHYYSEQVLRDSHKLFEGLKIFAYRFGDPLGERFDHAPDEIEQMRPEGFAENLVGWIKNVRFGPFSRPNGTSGQGLIARLHILEGAEWLRKNLKDGWKSGRPDLLGFSINVKGQVEPMVLNGQTVKKVARIDEAKSTEIVSEPAAGGSLLRLVASVQREASMPKEIYELVKKYRSKWLEGINAPGDDENMNDYVLRLFESNLSKAEAIQKEVPIDKGNLLKEVARGVNTLNMIVRLLTDGKIQEAMKMVNDWISGHPMSEEIYSFPSQRESGDPEKTPADPPKTDPSSEIPKADPKSDEAKKKEEEESMKKESALKVKESELRVRERLLESGLDEKGKAMVMKLLNGKVDIQESDIDAAIKEVKELSGQLSESGKPNGLGDAHNDSPSVEVTREAYDKTVAGLEKMLAPQWEQEEMEDSERKRLREAPTFRGLHHAFAEIAKPKRYMTTEDFAGILFQSIRIGFPRTESRIMESHLQGLRESMNSYMPTSLKEAISTTTFPTAFGDSLFRRLQKEYRREELNDWRKIISSTENLTDATNTFNIVRIGGVSTLPVVNQGAAYQELADPTEAKETLTPSKKGGLLKFTWEDVLADQLGVIRAVPRILGRTAARTVQFAVWDLIDTNASLASDSVALISTATHANRVATDPTLAYTAVSDAIEQLRGLTEQDSGNKLGLRAKFLIVSDSKEQEAIEITESTVKTGGLNDNKDDKTARSFVNFKRVETFSTIALGRASSAGPFWYVAASPADAETIAVGFLGGRDRPDMFVQSPVDTPNVGNAFDSDSLTFKSRFVFGVALVDFRWIVGSLASS